MKRTLSGILTSFVLLFGWIAPARAAEPAGGFDAANRLYEQGKFVEAASAYRELIAAGPVSAAVHFNLGNACFKAGEIGRAIAAYRQAQQIAPRDPDVRANLQFVRNQVQGPTLLPSRAQRWLARLSPNEWTAFAAVVLWLWLILLTAGQLRAALKVPLRPFVWASGAAFAILAICLGAALSAASGPSAVVTVSDAPVRNGPLDQSPVAATLHDGAELRVLDVKDDWLQVSIGDRNLGWLKREHAIFFPEDQVARKPG